MSLFTFVCAIFTRVIFIIISLIGVWRVTWIKHDNMYWLLTFLFIPFVIEMVIALKRREGQDYKWFSPAILLFLISIIPSMWILELHHQQNKQSDNKSLDKVHSSICPNAWILALHQFLLIFLIVGKWVLPRGGGVTRDELSQLLLIFVGTAADILEFTNETLSDVKENSPHLVYIILAVWTWSMLQFPLHLAVVNSKRKSETEGQDVGILDRRSTDIWTIAESLFLQDGPFLVVRLIVMIRFDVFNQMLVFFTIKNFLMVILNLYRLGIICYNFKRSGSRSAVF